MKSHLAFRAKNLANLPVPEVIETKKYEVILKERLQQLNGNIPLAFNADMEPVFIQADIVELENGKKVFQIPLDDYAGLYYTELESEPLVRLSQVDAYREAFLRAETNHAAISTLPAYATGEVLDHYALADGVTRLLITPENNETTPPTPAVWEDDDTFRNRWFLAMESKSNGGSEGWYLFHTLSADARVKDALAISPNPRGVLITILSNEGNGTATADLISAVEAHIKDQYNLVQTDEIIVQSAEINEYAIEADIWYYTGVSNEVVNTAINKAFEDYKKRTHRIGHVIDESVIYDFLMQEGVYKAEIKQPNLPIDNTQFQASYCIGLTINNRGEYGLL